MIHYHGVPITPTIAAVQVLRARHAMVSFANPDQIALVAEVCQSFTLDNGAFTAWKKGGKIDEAEFCDWVEVWGAHPGCDFALIPDVIEGTPHENDKLVDYWLSRKRPCFGIPVWHLHEPIARLEQLSYLHPWRVALGSSGEYADIGTEKWWHRMSEAMSAICDKDGRLRCKLHGLRMLNPTIFSHLPLSSADSTNIARNISIDQSWSKGPYAPLTDAMRALILAERIESHASADRWTRTRGTQQNLQLVG